jgi:hypothetical protein
MKKSILLTLCLYMTISFCSSVEAQTPGSQSAGTGSKALLYGKYRKDIGLNFDMGLNGSGQYPQVLKDHFSGEDLSGGMLWLSLGMGLDFRVINNLFIETRFSWLNSFVSIPSSLPGFNNEKINSVFLPGIGAKYYIFFNNSEDIRNNYSNFGIYVAGRLFGNKPSSDISDLTFSKGGGSRSLAAGMHCPFLIGSLNIEVGKRWIPVKVNEGVSAKEFGGIYAEISSVIYLFNYSGIKEKIK